MINWYTSYPAHSKLLFISPSSCRQIIYFHLMVGPPKKAIVPLWSNMKLVRFILMFYKALG